MKQLLIVFGLLLLISCQEDKIDYTKHEKGFEYYFYNQNIDAQKPNLGDIMILSMNYYYNGDSLLFSSKTLNKPFRMKLKRNKPNGETIDDALAMMHIGDSASFKVNASMFYNITKKQMVPINVKQDDQIVFYVKLISTTSYQDFRDEKSKASENDSQEDEQALLSRFVKMSGITVESTNSGLFFIEEQKGTGKIAKKGDKVTMHYLGYFISGESFSSTYDSGRPFSFTLGIDDLIAGFQEGVAGMQAEGRYKLVIPSYLAYGKEGNEAVPANKTLIFEINVLSVE